MHYGTGVLPARPNKPRSIHFNNSVPELFESCFLTSTHCTSARFILCGPSLPRNHRSSAPTARRGKWIDTARDESAAVVAHSSLRARRSPCARTALAPRAASE
jgi:hypothetical protein